VHAFTMATTPSYPSPISTSNTTVRTTCANHVLSRQAHLKVEQQKLQLLLRQALHTGMLVFIEHGGHDGRHNVLLLHACDIGSGAKQISIRRHEPATHADASSTA